MNARLAQIQNQNWPELAWQADWSVSNLAKLAQVPPRTLERYFLKTERCPPKAWLNMTRQMHALGLLRNHSVKETADLLGYRHATTFAREFKKLTGLCPKSMIRYYADQRSPRDCRKKL